MTGEVSNWSIDYYEKNTKNCDDWLKVQENYNTVPLINATPLDNFKDGSLIRYQGMVQDMLNPEFYYSSYTVHKRITGESVVKSGKFRDMTDCEENESLMTEDNESVPKERQVFFCVPVPGLSLWVQQHQERMCNANNVSPSSDKSNNILSDSSARKRAAEENDGDGDCEMEVGGSDYKSTESHVDKKITSETSTSSSVNNIYNNDKYFPVPGQTGLPCIVKIYEEEEKLDILLNDRIEVLGFLSLNPALEATWEGSDAEDKALHPPPSSVPRIHTIAIKKLQHCNPLLKENALGDIRSEAEKTRSDLHLVLTQILYGDTVAADYLICHLLSKVYIRDDSHTLGQFSLNISNIKSPSYAKRFYHILECLVTNSQYISLSIPLLNESSFIPKKDYESNRLWSGRLQLCDDTHLVLDETQMREGQLNHIGCLNLSALQTVMRDQEISYDFGYYPVKYNTNIPVLILSEGKSMLETNIRLKLKPDESMASTIDETFDAAEFFLNGEISNKIRIYLSSMRLHEFEMTEDVMKKIGDDYVTMRQQDSRVTSCDLHVLLVLSRLLALSYGRTVLSTEDWRRAIDMETERKIRSA